MTSPSSNLNHFGELEPGGFLKCQGLCTAIACSFNFMIVCQYIVWTLTQPHTPYLYKRVVVSTTSLSTVDHDPSQPVLGADRASWFITRSFLVLSTIFVLNVFSVLILVLLVVIISNVCSRTDLLTLGGGIVKRHRHLNVMTNP